MDSKYNITLNGHNQKVNLFGKHTKHKSPQKKKKLKVVHIAQENNDKNDYKPAEVAKPQPKLSFLEQRRNLPVYGVRKRLLDEIKKNDTTIIIGETGSGKTTQIPQMIHEARIEGVGTIGITQPRRVAAITIAMRVAQEMNTTLGEIVGYNVRFEDMTSHKTKVKYMTDGMLLREAMLDPLLKSYSIIVIDEAHERTVGTDVLLGIIKQAQKDRKTTPNPLKIIVMSATMNVDIFSNYLNRCPVIYLEGRTHPVTVFYMKKKSNDYQHKALCTVFQIHKETPINHDILVFLTGQEEIESLTYSIRQIAKELKMNNAIRVYPLFAGLPPSQQLEAWKPTPPSLRKVVLATNIAETSITIPNIKYVIDSGVVKSRRYCSTTGAEFLRVEPCSQAACWQRTGRAGRDSPGRCYRLYTSEHFSKLSPHTFPDILRCPMASTVLQLLALNVDPLTFDLIDKPPEEAMKGALYLLKQLGAVSGNQSVTLTHIGKKMAAFPIDPKLAKVLLNAPEYGCLEEALSIVALLSSEGVFHCPISKREQALTAKDKFISPLGDHITLLNVYKGFCNAPLKKQWCRDNFLNFRNLKYAQDVRRQLSDLCILHKLQNSSCGTSYEQVIKCLIAGLFVNLAWVRNSTNISGSGRYMTASGMAAAIHPSSVLHGKSPPPQCLLYTELISTHRTYVNCLSLIESDWLYQIVPEFARKCRTLH